MPTPQNGQTHSNNLSATADEFTDCAWAFVGLALKDLHGWSPSMRQQNSKKNYNYKRTLYSG